VGNFSSAITGDDRGGGKGLKSLLGGGSGHCRGGTGSNSYGGGPYMVRHVGSGQGGWTPGTVEDGGGRPETVRDGWRLQGAGGNDEGPQGSWDGVSDVS